MIRATRITHACRYLVLIFGVVLLAGCSGSRQLDAWFVDSLVKVFPDDPKPAVDASAPVLEVARNGHTSLQLVLRSEQDVTGVSVELQAPESGAARLKSLLRSVGYVPVDSNTPKAPADEIIRKAPASFPDPLFEDLPSEIKGRQDCPYWITIYAPADVNPGTYSGKIRVLVNGALQEELPFAVEVGAARVPTQRRLNVTNWFTLGRENMARYYDLKEGTDDYWQLLENIGRVMADHRQNMILTPVMSLVKPTLKGRNWEFDFSDFDRWVQVFQDAGLLGTIEGGHLLSRGKGYYSPLIVPAYVAEKGKPVEKQLDPDDARAKTYLTAFLKALHTHLKERGWLDHYVQHVLDEPHGKERPYYEKYAKLVRQNLPEVKTIDAVDLKQNTGFLDKWCDIWVPVLGSFDDELDVLHKHSASENGETWFYTCIGPQGRYLNRFMDYSLLKVRLLHWFNFRHQLTGFLHWGGNYWSAKPFEQVQPVINDGKTLLPAGDCAIVYPDRAHKSILSSIRLEAMMEGIEDYELLTDLAAKDPAAADKLAKEAIPNIVDYIRKPAEFRKLQKSLISMAQ